MAKGKSSGASKGGKTLETIIIIVVAVAALYFAFNTFGNNLAKQNKKGGFAIDELRQDPRPAKSKPAVVKEKIDKNADTDALTRSDRKELNELLDKVVE